MSAKQSMVPKIMPLLGKVALEEAFQPPWEMEAATGSNISLYVYKEREAEYTSGIVNIADRVKEARATGVGYTICSQTVPGVQGEVDPAKAETFATRSNDWIAEQIKAFPGELGAFGAVSMHNPEQAVVEMTRCIKELGFHGIMVNNWQQAIKPNGERTLLLYDGPEYDVFWSALEELDVPLYIHPSAPEAQVLDLLYHNRTFLIGPPSSFAVDVSHHALSLIINGVFDRHPKAQVILGHMGERLPYDLDRTHRWLELVEKRRGMTAKKTVYDYFSNNIWITTSGQFSTAVLDFCINLIGADRILFSVDYPYEVYQDASDWFDNVNINTRDKLKIGRENAQKLLKLGEYKDYNAPYHQ
jgi:2,3-dihydroxybenzoate decarboxylase